MALAENVQKIMKLRRTLAMQVRDAAAVFTPAFLGLVGRGDATAADRGRVEPWTAAANQIPMGLAKTQETGDVAATPPPEAKISLDGEVLEQVSVTGLASREDIGRKVYYSDDDTLTLVRPALGIPVGMVSEFYSGTSGDVMLFSATEMAVLALAGSAQYTWHLGTVTAAHTVSGNMLTGIEAPHHGRITRVYGIVSRAATDADVDIDINLEINGVDLTGGVIEYLFSDAIGTKKVGTAITDDGLNAFHEGDLIDVEALVNTAGTATDVGQMELYAEVQTDFGL